MARSSRERFLELLDKGILKKGNEDRLLRICYDVAKVIFLRQERLRKSQLKIREISSAVTLVHFHHSNSYHFDVVGSLAANFSHCPEEKALQYYEDQVMGVTVDAFGRRVLIDEDGMKSLYKERGTGAHVVDSKNYEEFRGKRLPWIRQVLQNSKAVYVVEEVVHGKFRRTHIYTGVASIPLKPKPCMSHFIVVVSEDPHRNLKFVTAYAINQTNRFLKCIEPGRPHSESWVKVFSRASYPLSPIAV